MAKFRIVASRRAQNPKQSEFDLEMHSGKLHIGDTFLCFDTHHPVKFPILSIAHRADVVTVTCDQWLGWDDQFAGAFIDMDAPPGQRRFYYPTPKI